MLVTGVTAADTDERTTLARSPAAVGSMPRSVATNSPCSRPVNASYSGGSSGRYPM
jgi:hypothetical protein